MKEFDVDLVFTFSGWCRVKAKNEDEAREIARKYMTACCPTIEDSGCNKIVDFSCDTSADVESY